MASNAPSATNGLASNPIRKSANNMASLKHAPALDSSAKAKAALICINNAIAKILINTPAPEPDTPVAPAPPATANTPLVNAPADMSGKTAVAKFKMNVLLFAILVVCIIVITPAPAVKSAAKLCSV